MTRGISVVIPAWCEAEGIADAVRAARLVGDEVVVADAASPDGTAELARAAGARVVTTPKGRGVQLAHGARFARLDTLLFVHADARLAPEARTAIERALSAPEVGGGNFFVRFEPDGHAARLFTWANDVRRRWLRVYYGDSAIFVRREVYEAIGGFRPMPLFEDYDLVRRLERAARTVYVRDVEVRVSARRFEAMPVRTLAIWSALQVLYSSGVPADALARFYRDLRRDGRVA